MNWEFFIIGLVASFLTVGLALLLFPKIGLLDFPQRYGLDRARIPYPGGLVLLLLSLGICLIDRQFWVLLPALLLVGGVSFLDDRNPLSISIRTLAYLLSITWIFYHGIKIDFIGIPWQETNWELADKFWLSFLVTIIWIFIIQQAMNWFDGIRGLCVGVSGIGFLTLGILGIIRPELFFDPAHQSLTTINLFLAGLCLGGWIWFYQGKIILGDTGSQVLGFLLGAMAIWSGAKIMTTLIVLALPLIDVGLVVLRRIIIEKRSPLKGDGQHLPHNLSRKIGEPSASVLLLILSGIFGTIAVFFTGTTKLVALGLIGLLVVALGIHLLKYQSSNSKFY